MKAAAKSRPVAPELLTRRKLHHVEFFYTSEIGMDGLLKEQELDPDRFKALLHLKKEYLYLAFSKDIGDERIARWRAALEEVKCDGTLGKIYHDVYSHETIKEICLPGDPLAR